MAEEQTESGGIRRDRHEHGGASPHVDDDALARLTERERFEAGLINYDPDDVPPATDPAPPQDITESEEYQEEGAEIDREVADGELRPLNEESPFPPSHYDS